MDSNKKYIRGTFAFVWKALHRIGFSVSVYIIGFLFEILPRKLPSMKWNSLPEISCVLAGFAGKQMPGSISYLKTVCLSFYFMHEKESFFLGIFLGFILLFVCSLRIWDIQITGNRYYTTPVLLDTLSEWDIRCGMAKRNVDCQKLMQKIRQAFPGVVWVSAKLEGTCLIIDIRENDESRSQRMP